METLKGLLPPLSGAAYASQFPPSTLCESSLITLEVHELGRTPRIWLEHLAGNACAEHARGGAGSRPQFSPLARKQGFPQAHQDFPVGLECARLMRNDTEELYRFVEKRLELSRINKLRQVFVFVDRCKGDQVAPLAAKEKNQEQISRE